MVSTRASATGRRRYGGLAARERVARRRALLLAAALARFGCDGFAATGVKDVCRDAGLTDRYFYESFANREALLLAVFDAAAEDLLARTAAAVAAAPPTAAARVQAAVAAFVRALAEDRQRARVLFVEVQGVSAAVERHARRSLLRFVALLAATAREYLPRRFTAAQVRVGALSLVGAMQQVVIAWQHGELDVSVEQLIEHFVTVVLAIGKAYGMKTTRRRR
jgi:AcrR family transcriptional regulator